MNYRIAFILFAFFSASSVIAAIPKYSGFSVSLRDDPKTSFNFSSGDATSSSPIVISVSGRKLTDADRAHRVELQKLWLSQHVPSSAHLILRTLSDCGLNRKGELPACDRYVFEDPATKQELIYYIYVGNWP